MTNDLHQYIKQVELGISSIATIIKLKGNEESKNAINKMVDDIAVLNKHAKDRNKLREDIFSYMVAGDRLHMVLNGLDLDTATLFYNVVITYFEWDLNPTKPYILSVHGLGELKL